MTKLDLLTAGAPFWSQAQATAKRFVFALVAELSVKRTRSSLRTPVAPPRAKYRATASGWLAYWPTQDRHTDLTKFGFLVYAGTARDFYEWEFRALTRWNQTEKDDKKALASKILDSLRASAYIIAEDLGSDVLYLENNIPAIVEAVRKNLFPLLEQESKELYRLGTQVGGTLARQPGEPTVSYIARRKKWWRKLQQLDKNVAINEAVRKDLILDNSGLSRQERLIQCP